MARLLMSLPRASLTTGCTAVARALRASPTRQASEWAPSLLLHTLYRLAVARAQRPRPSTCTWDSPRPWPGAWGTEPRRQRCADLQTGCSVAPDLAVERVALQRRAPGSADQPHHLVDVALVAHPGRGDHVLLDHRGAHVVGAEGQGHLPHLQALRNPGGLDAGHVVEVDAAHGEQTQVVEAGGGRVAGRKLRVAGLEGPRNERREAPGLVLQVADAAQVLDALGRRVDRAEHHRRGGLHAEAVGDAHHVEPRVGGDLVRADGRAHPVDEDLGAAAGQAVEAGGVEAAQRLLDAQVAGRRDVHDLRRRERVDVDRVARLDAAEDPLEPADVEVGVQAALHHDGRAAERQRLLDLAVDVVLGQEVALAAPRLLVEGAEAATREAVISVVDVAVDDERD